MYFFFALQTLQTIQLVTLHDLFSKQIVIIHTVHFPFHQEPITAEQKGAAWKFHYTPWNSWLTLKMLVMTIDAQWEGMGDVRSARYEPALFPPWPTIRV